MSKRFEELKSILAEINPDAVMLDGLESALIGIGHNGGDHVAIYDEAKCIKAFEKQGMTQEEAIEWYEYNTVRALPYAGKHAPVIMKLAKDLI